jgi:hypothetical protein
LFRQGALKTVQFAPRGHGYYDAFANRPDSATVSATTGPCTCIAGYSTDVVSGTHNVYGTYDVPNEDHSGVETLNYSGNQTLVLFNPGASDAAVAAVYTLVNSTSDPNKLEVAEEKVKCRQFQELGPTILPTNKAHANNEQGLVDGDPAKHDKRPTRNVESIPLRGSLRMRNISEALYLGGSVRFMRYNGSLTLREDTYGDSVTGPLSVASFVELAETIRDSPRTRVFTGKKLVVAHQSNSYPADFVRSMRFESGKALEAAFEYPAYCTVCVLIDNFTTNTGVNNTYEFNFNVQKAARFGPGTLLAGMQREIRVLRNDVHHLRESQAEAARPVGSTGGPASRDQEEFIRE